MINKKDLQKYLKEGSLIRVGTKDGQCLSFYYVLSTYMMCRYGFHDSKVRLKGIMELIETNCKRIEVEKYNKIIQVMEG